jgi:ferrous iron transport protein B
MAIYFPLFTLLEDAGNLPRVAYNLDKPFQRCPRLRQAGALYVHGLRMQRRRYIGCRIIDSPRERLLAILTNSFVPCNGPRFPPTLIAIIAMFFAIPGAEPFLLCFQRSC